MKNTTKGSIGAAIVILICIALGILLCSCKPEYNYERVVVTYNSYPTKYVNGYKYNLKRIENQNTTITLYRPVANWHVGDTILLYFPNNF